MKRLLIATLIAAGPVMADESPFLKDAALAAEVKRNCADGCVVLSPAEAHALTESINQVVKDRRQEAFDEGRKYEHSACRNRL